MAADIAADRPVDTSPDMAAGTEFQEILWEQ